MYYTGTQQQCESYNQEVTKGEGYQGSTSRWANIITHPTEDKFAIIANEKYPSTLESLEALSEDWFESF
jgi:hypothetical protein